MAPDYKDYLKGTAEVLKESKKEKKKYTVKILGKKFIVFPNVFSPKYFFDTEFFAKELIIKEGEDFLEIGPGTGVISIFAALKGASKVVAIDINADAVVNTKENSKLNNVEVNVFQGNVYDKLKDNEKFDTIFWNTPFGYVEEKDIPDLEKSVFDPGYKSTKKFIFGAKKHLKPNGHLLIGFSTTLGKFDILKNFLKEAGFNVKLIAKIKSEETHPVFFELFEAVPTN